jgi:toxin ParE1/3/4
MNIVIREEAVDDLDSIFAWIARDNPRAAAATVRLLRERIEVLATPGLDYIGRRGRAAETRELVEPPYIIVYQVIEERQEIVIIAILHAAQNR